MVDLDKCDIKGCNNSWAYRVNILDMCEEHYQLWMSNLKQKHIKEEK